MIFSTDKEGKLTSDDRKTLAKIRSNFASQQAAEAAEAGGERSVGPGATRSGALGPY
jgi:hypothetical protein